MAVSLKFLTRLLYKLCSLTMHLGPEKINICFMLLKFYSLLKVQLIDNFKKSHLKEMLYNI